MALPSLVSSGDVISSVQANAVRNSLATWSFAVDAQNNELRNVGPFSAASGVFSGDVSAAAISGTSLSASGAVTAATATISGGLFAGAISSTGVFTCSNNAVFTGSIAGASLTVSGAVNASSVAATGAVTGASATFTGNVTAANFVISGAASGSSASFTGVLSCAGLVNSGVTLLAGSDIKYVQCESAHLAFYKKTGPFNYYWRRSDTGHNDGANTAELMSLDDLGNLTLFGSAPGTQLRLQSSASADVGFRLLDSTRDWKIGLNVGATGLGRLSIWNITAGRPLLLLGDAEFWIDVNGAGLRKLTIDSNNFIKAL